GCGIVSFTIRVGNKVNIADIEFVGNDHVSSRRLKRVLESKKWLMISWLTGSGRFRVDLFEDDLDNLRDFFREQCFRDVEIAEDQILVTYPSPGKLVLIINIDEGRQYRLGDVGFSGNELFASDLLARVVRQKPGMVFIPSRIDEDRQRLEDFYGKDGYLDT